MSPPIQFQSSILASQFKTTHAGHIEVGDHYVKGHFNKKIQRIGTRLNSRCIMPEIRQLLTDQQPVSRVIIHDHDP